MRLLPAPEKQSITRRQAFSLVELMVVMVIIGILGALIAGVVVKAVSAQRTSTTLTTMEVIKSGLSRQLQEISDAARKAGKSPTEIYQEVKSAFPDSYDQAGINYTDAASVPIPAYASYFRYKSTISASLNSDQKSSVFLRMILDKGPKSKIDTDQLPKGALGLINGVNAILDAWGDPIGVLVSVNPGVNPGVNPATLKAIITLSSPNATLKN